MNKPRPFLDEHIELTRRFFMKAGMGSLAIAASWGGRTSAAPVSKELNEKLARFETYLTPDERFADVSRGNPVPHSLPDDKKQEVGLTQDTWRLEIISDPDQPVKLHTPLTKAAGTAIDFKALMTMAENHAVRFSEDYDVPEPRMSARNGHLGGSAAA